MTCVGGTAPLEAQADARPLQSTPLTQIQTETHQDGAEQTKAALQAAAAADDAPSSRQPSDQLAAAASGTRQASEEQPAKPVADMAALAQRIGASAAAPVMPHAATSLPHASHAVANGIAATGPAAPVTPAVAGAPVPAEIKAIIQKLVSFIKVGPPGQADCNMHSAQYATTRERPSWILSCHEAGLGGWSVVLTHC